MTYRLESPSRLHFGLLAAQAAGTRAFGSVGLMIERPGVGLQARTVTGCECVVRGDVSPSVLRRAQALLEHLAERFPSPDGSAVEIELLWTAPEHAGLGLGTQLSMAVARAFHHQAGRTPVSIELGRQTGRGQRSAIGIHGFDHGGFLVDGGKRVTGAVAPLVARMDFPTDWPILLIGPDLPAGLHGHLERQAFAKNHAVAASTTDRLARLVLLALLPALAETDYQAFGEAIYEFNRTVGEFFAFAQGGPYAHPKLAAIVDWLRACSVPAVGQSSWGPTLFAILPDTDRVDWLRTQLDRQFALSQDQCLLTRANNTGAIATDCLGSC